MIEPEWVKTRSFILWAGSGSGMEELRERISKILRPLLESEGYELVEVEVRGSSRRRIVSVYIHKPGGVTFKDCADVSYMIQPVLEAKGILTGRYTLEVASPGLDRPLKEAADFRRVIGRLVKVRTSEPIAGTNEVKGRLLEVGEEEIELEVERGRSKELLKIPLSKIISGKVELEF